MEAPKPQAGAPGGPNSGAATVPSAETVSPARALKLKRNEIWKTIKERMEKRRKAFLEFTEDEIADYEKEPKRWNENDAYSKWENIVKKSTDKRARAYLRLKEKLKSRPIKRKNMRKRYKKRLGSSNTWSSESFESYSDLRKRKTYEDFVSLKTPKSIDAGWKNFGTVRNMSREKKRQVSNYLWNLQKNRLAQIRRAVLRRGLSGYTKGGPVTPFKREVLSSEKWMEIQQMMEKKRRRAIEQGLFRSTTETPEERRKRQNISNAIWERIKKGIDKQQRKYLGVRGAPRPFTDKRRKAISDISWRRIKGSLERQRRRVLAPSEMKKSKKRKDLSYKMWRKHYKALERKQLKVLGIKRFELPLSPMKRKMRGNDILYDLKNKMKEKRRRALASAFSYGPRYNVIERNYKSDGIWEQIREIMEARRQFYFSQGIPRQYSAFERSQPYYYDYFE